eukprot:m.86992 g.86992  ORF g.86992 m.86992 type:complete len:500 (-) comp13082_c0_seq1:101-1600(-)
MTGNDKRARGSIQAAYESDVEEQSRGRSPIGILGLLVIGYFWISGGIYGNETILLDASPGVSLVANVAIAFLYGVPTAMVAMEMASAWPLDGGSVAWVEVAYGPILGAHNTFWLWLAYTLDGAIYPIIAAQYITNYWNVWGFYNPNNSYDDVDLGIVIISMMILLPLTLMQMRGTEVLISFSFILAVLSLLPGLIFIFWGLEDVPLDFFTDFELPNKQETNWPLLLSWVLWLNSGTIALGSLAAEIVEPEKTMPKVMWILIPFVLFINVSPLAVSWGMDKNNTHYQPGYFNVLARTHMGSWLGWMMLVGSVLAQLGLCNAAIMACQRMGYFFFQTRFPEVFSKKQSGLFHYLWIDDSRGVPAGIILLQNLICMVCCFIPYGVLVECIVLISAPCFLLMLITFIRLRIDHPHVDRPFKCPGGLYMGVLMILPPFALTLFQFYVTVKDSTAVFGVPYFKAVAFAIVIVLGLFIHLLAHFIYSFGNVGHQRLVTESDPLIQS